MCECVRERERKRDREKERESEREKCTQSIVTLRMNNNVNTWSYHSTHRSRDVRSFYNVH